MTPSLAELEQQGKLVEITTQNIDCLHQKAGSSIVHEIHGTIGTVRGHCGNLHAAYEAQGEVAEGIQTEGDQGKMGGSEGDLRDS